MIVAILFVKAVGFGALAGILALTVASIGFIGKLFTEAVEEISLKQVEAVRATGASFSSVLAFGVVPQVFSRFIGFATYQLDSNLRNSTMVGIVGAGGIGGTLFAAFQRFDYDFVCAILLSIIALIMLGEILATGVRKIFLRTRRSPTCSGAATRRPRAAPGGRLMAAAEPNAGARGAAHLPRPRTAASPTASGGASRRAQRLARFAVYLVIVAAIVMSVQHHRDHPGIPATTRPEQMADLLHADVAARLARTTPRRVHAALIETIHIATLGTLLALVLALPVGRARGAQPRAVDAAQPLRQADPGVVAHRSTRWSGRCCSSASSARARSPARWRSRSARSASSASCSARRWRRRSAGRSRR